jgi:hypothetical protein
MRIAMCFAAVFAGGCGEDDAGPDLAGTWVLEGSPCVLGLVIDGRGPGTYETDFVCQLENGSFAVEADVGEYMATDDSITFRATRSSCAGSSKAGEVFTYEFLDDNQLRLVSPEGLIVMNRVTGDDEGPSAIGQFGCFAEDGTFTPMPVAEL